MNINYKEPQFELFPANSATLEDINKPKFLLATLTLSTESLVILVILGIMIALFSFSLGVERGRHLAAQSLDEKISAAWNVGGRRLSTVPSVPVATTSSIPLPATNKVVGNAGFIHSGFVAKVTKTAPKAFVAKTMPTATVSTSGSKWTVQVGTFKNENYAQQEALGLKAKGYPVFLIKSKDFYLLCVGNYGSSTQADSFLKKIQAKYQGSQVRRF
ncbi:MAG: SPOR domain-containing protein [Candidatus Omnitrophota bacterium]